MIRIVVGALTSLAVGVALVLVGTWMLPMAEAGHPIAFDFLFIVGCMVALVISVAVFDLISGLGIFDIFDSRR